MKIGIDARLYGTKHGGIGRYAQELIKNLERLDSQNQYFVFLSADNFLDYEPAAKNFRKVRADFKVYGFFEQLLFPILLYKYNLDLVHFTHFNAPLLYVKKFIVTIHDLIISHYPSSRATTLHPAVYKLKLGLYDFLIKAVAQKADKIIAVSEFTKKDIVRLLKIKPEKIQVVYEGVDLPAENGDCAQIAEKLGLNSQFLLYVGSAYPHKNLEKLITAFHLLKKDFPDLQLALVGRNNFFYRRLQQWVRDGSDLKNGESGIVFTDYLNDRDLACLYRRAKAYVFPSLIEGFGLPPLEAQNYDLPVASSNYSCLPEILGESAVYFDPEDPASIASAVRSILIDNELEKKLISAGRENLKRYSWKKMAKEILALY